MSAITYSLLSIKKIKSKKIVCYIKDFKKSLMIFLKVKISCYFWETISLIILSYSGKNMLIYFTVYETKYPFIKLIWHISLTIEVTWTNDKNIFYSRDCKLAAVS